MAQESGSSKSPKWRLNLYFPSKAPAFGCRYQPHIHMLIIDDSFQFPPHKYSFTWYREDVCLSPNQEKVRCFVHHEELATIQCTVCVSQNRLGKISYYCSISCYKAAWDKHKVHHHFAAPNPDPQAVKIIKSFGPYGSYPDLPDYQDDGSQPDETVEQDGKTWIEVGSSEYYVPTENDIGFCLRLKFEVVDSSTFTQLFPARIKVTDPVIYPPPHPPRCTMWNSCNADLKEHSSNDVTFRVLSYNILADYLATSGSNWHFYCPDWALSWEYRLQNSLYEIIEYDADILCLQEVQKDHFENFLKPELAKYGYSVIYKKKKFETYSFKSHHTTDGCATFYHCQRFKEIATYELEFNNSAKPLVDSLVGKQKSEARRLLKDNVALVVILEMVENEDSSDGNRPRICVSNTHLHANVKNPDIKLLQVATLIHALEKIAKLKIPLLICADLNSVPQSDPYTFISKGRVEILPSKEIDQSGILQTLKLSHSLNLVSAYATFFQSDRVKDHQREKMMNPGTKEPLFTNFTPSFFGTIDYIFYTGTVHDFYNVSDFF
ncbi:carbon catabolite repressor protein 4 1-like [Pyrus ussuriensis x Pyrus communis]|uniref:Carbon catabolite repressor protein 4 1-like n=1 Tax=Pyrus ussuriensis x Pyrus communis TaxID=2448454 RepID=A0A5N5GPC8_9ROSA|nr:carbon catabolite repressor protein 4 1-like [Pyrus ussuriensis x Pyrus communis]